MSDRTRLQLDRQVAMKWFSHNVCFQNVLNKISQVFGWTMYGSGNVESVVGRSSMPHFGYQR
jgi:hypothetical protein